MVTHAWRYDTSSRANATQVALELRRFVSDTIGRCVCQLLILGEIPMRVVLPLIFHYFYCEQCYPYDVNDIIYSCDLWRAGFCRKDSRSMLKIHLVKEELQCDRTVSKTINLFVYQISLVKMLKMINVLCTFTEIYTMTLGTMPTLQVTFCLTVLRVWGNVSLDNCSTVDSIVRICWCCTTDNPVRRVVVNIFVFDENKALLQLASNNNIRFFTSEGFSIQIKCSIML